MRAFAATAMDAWAALRRDGRGVTAVEYAVIAAIFAIGLVTSFTSLGTKLGSTFTNVASKM